MYIYAKTREKASNLKIMNIKVAQNKMFKLSKVKQMPLILIQGISEHPIPGDDAILHPPCISQKKQELE